MSISVPGGALSGALRLPVLGCQLPVQSPNSMARKSCASTGDGSAVKAMAPAVHCGAV
jgi:hypothetical protein